MAKADHKVGDSADFPKFWALTVYVALSLEAMVVPHTHLHLQLQEGSCRVGRVELQEVPPLPLTTDWECSHKSLCTSLSSLNNPISL